MDAPASLGHGWVERDQSRGLAQPGNQASVPIGVAAEKVLEG